MYIYILWWPRDRIVPVNRDQLRNVITVNDKVYNKWINSINYSQYNYYVFVSNERQSKNKCERIASFICLSLSTELQI